MQIAYDEYWIHESWINEWNQPHQNTHNHGNSIIMYITLSLFQDPPLVFEKVAFNTDPFIHRKHYNRAIQTFRINLVFHVQKVL